MNATIYVFSSPLQSFITRYLELKRTLGREYKSEYRIFQHLDKFLCSTNSDLNSESFTAWCLTQQHKASGVRRNWMRNVYNLCLYRRRTEPSCFLPDPAQFPGLHQPVQPHIFSESEIIRLLDATKKLQPGTNSPLRQENIKLALVLLYTTGLRRGELLKLTIGDYDPNHHTLLIRASKFHKSRLIPLSSDGWNELENYLEKRRCMDLPIGKEYPLIWNNHSQKKRIGFYTGTGLLCNFHSLFRWANIHTASGKLPRIHDFRHSLAVHALLRGYQEGTDVQTKLPVLATYMGHVSVVSTEYYLRFIEKIINAANDRFEKCYGALVVTKNHERGEL